MCGFYFEKKYSIPVSTDLEGDLQTVVHLVEFIRLLRLLNHSVKVKRVHLAKVWTSNVYKSGIGTVYFLY